MRAEQTRSRVRKEEYGYRLFDSHELRAKFKADLMTELGLSDHPKAEAFYKIAYDLGYPGGFMEIVVIAERMAELLK